MIGGSESNFDLSLAGPRAWTHRRAAEFGLMSV
jgi:hypothetical protein